jgi:hypothetical protein
MNTTLAVGFASLLLVAGLAAPVATTTATAAVGAQESNNTTTTTTTTPPSTTTATTTSTSTTTSGNDSTTTVAPTGPIQVQAQLQRGITVVSYEFLPSEGVVEVVLDADRAGYLIAVKDQSPLLRVAVKEDGGHQQIVTHARRVTLESGRQTVDIPVSPVEGVAVFSISGNSKTITFSTGTVGDGGSQPVERETVTMLLVGSVGATALAITWRTRKKAEQEEFTAERVN